MFALTKEQNDYPCHATHACAASEKRRVTRNTPMAYFCEHWFLAFFSYNCLVNFGDQQHSKFQTTRVLGFRIQAVE